MISEEWMAAVRVFDYDGGTSANVEGPKRQRYPSSYDQAVHANHVGIVGASHLAWAMKKAIVRNWGAGRVRALSAIAD